MQRILVTGGKGFMGSHVVKKLATNYPEFQVYATYHPRGKAPPSPWDKYAKFIAVDLSKEEKVQKLFQNEHSSSTNKFDLVIHLAARVKNTQKFNIPGSILAENLKINSNIFLEAQRSGVKRIVYISTHGLLNLDKIPDDGYTFSKLAGEILCRAFQKQFGLEYTILRLIDYAYGPINLFDGTKEKIIAKKNQLVWLTKQILEKKRVVKTKGPTTQKRPWIHFSDLSEAIILSAIKKQAKNQEIFISREEAFNMEEIAFEIARIAFPKKAPKFKLEGDSNFKVINFQTDFSKTKKILNWQPKYNLKNSLPEMVEWVKTNFNLND